MTKFDLSMCNNFVILAGMVSRSMVFYVQDCSCAVGIDCAVLCGSCIFTLSESLATSLVHGSRNPSRKTIRYSFNPV